MLFPIYDKANGVIPSINIQLYNIFEFFLSNQYIVITDLVCYRKKRVCTACLREAQTQQDSLVNCLCTGKLLLAEKLPPTKTTVVLTDSDSDPSDGE